MPNREVPLFVYVRLSCAIVVHDFQVTSTWKFLTGELFVRFFLFTKDIRNVKP